MDFTRRPIAECVRKVSQIAPASNPNDQFLYVDLSSIDKDEKRIVTAAVQRLNWEDAPSRARQLVQTGDILVSTVRPNLNGVAQIDANYDGAIASTGFCVLRTEPDVLDSRYLFHWLCSPKFVAEMVKFSTGASYPAVSDRIIYESLIPLPSDVNEQRRIATILDKADAIRTKRREVLKLTDKFLRSLFLDMFGDPVANPKGWPMLPLSDCSERIQIGPFGTQLHQEDYIEGGIPLINPTHIVNGKIVVNNSLTIPNQLYSKLTEYHLMPGDIIMGRRGEMGRCALVTEIESGYLCGTGSLFIRSDKNKVLPIYLTNVLSSNSAKLAFERASLGATMPNLNKGIVSDFQIGIPPIDLQMKFSKLVAINSRLNEKLHIAMNEANELFNSLQQRAFAG